MDSVKRRKVFYKKVLDEGGLVGASVHGTVFYIIRQEGAYCIGLGDDYSGEKVLSQYYSYDELLTALLVIAPFEQWKHLIQIDSWFHGFGSAFNEYEVDGDYRQNHLDNCKDNPEYERGYNDGLIWYKSQFSE